MTSLDAYANEKLAQITHRGLYRTLKPTGRTSATGAVRNDHDLISFCCNDYLNLSHHPDVIAAAQEATARYGVGSGGSRLISGNVPLYEKLENTLAALKGTEAAIVFGSGYLANIGIIPCVVGSGDLILSDELNHACLHAGAKLSGANVHVYRHGDANHVADLLNEHRKNHRHCLIVTDSVFSMDGDIAPLDRLIALADTHDCWLMTDDAHGIGVVNDGHGCASAAIPLQMGTLSKAVGAYGGYLCASQAIVDLIRNRARSFIYTTGLPPGTLAAATKAIKIIATDPALCARPVEHAAYFCAQMNLPAPESPIVPLVLGSADRVMIASQALEERGFLVTGIRPPTVPEGTARLRLTFTAEHTKAEIDGLITVLHDLGLTPS